MKKILVLQAICLLASSTAMAQTLQLLTWKSCAPNELVGKFEKESGIKVEAISRLAFLNLMVSVNAPGRLTV